MALKEAVPAVPQTTAVSPSPDPNPGISAEFAAFRQELDRLRRENEAMKADIAAGRIPQSADRQFPKPVKGKTVLVRATQEGGFYPHVSPDGVKTHSGCGMGFPRALGEIFLCVESEVSKRRTGGSPGWMELYVPNVTKPLPVDAPLTTAANMIPNPMTGGQMQTPGTTN